MKIQIKNRFNGDILFECDSENIGEAVALAIKAKACLRSADLRYADLSSANLRSANLHSADLSYADLSSADLSSADLSSANLSSADLRYADLSYADLSSANLSYAKNSTLAIAMTRILPGGELIGWKKCKGGVIVKLRIPADAKRSHAFGRKCRAEFADVLETSNGKTAKSGHSDSHPVVEYRVGNRVTCDKWCDDFTNECAGGIHFFITREEAEAY